MTSLPITGPSRYSIYTGRVTNWPAVVVSSALALLMLALAVGSEDNDNGWSLAGLALLGLLVAIGVFLTVITCTSVRAAAGPNGVTIRWGIAGWPRLTYRLADIERAEVFNLSLWWVAWGYWWTPKRTCCTVRSGPTLRLVLRNGRTVTVSVPDPAVAVAAIDAAQAGEAG